MTGTTSPESNWPGEREPSCHDVQVASEQPAPAFLSDFKAALLASSDAAGNEDLMHLDLQLNEGRRYTYPLVLLSDFPKNLPSPSEIIGLREIFSSSCASHVFFNRLPIPPPSRKSVTPPLPLAIACLASAHARHDPAKVRDLFVASFDLWGSILEVDNREARSLESLMTAIFLSLYGALSSDETVWGRAGLVQCSAVTIARRMRHHDPRQLEDLLGLSAPSYSGAFVWCLWLVDILQALHFDLSINTFTSRELWTTMPSSSLNFQDTYRALLDDGMPQKGLPEEAASQDDALLLLMAILSDSLYLRASLGQMVRLVKAKLRPDTKQNPFVPLSPHTELERMERVLSLALDKWYGRFHARVPPEIMAFYHYCRMHLSCDQLLRFPQAAGYALWTQESNANHELSVTDEAVHQAWLVLDNAAVQPGPPSTDKFCPVWLPIMIFHAGLVVWINHNLGGSQQWEEYKSAKVLLAFKVELEGMHWPCCVEMAATLGRLMAGSMPGRQQ